MFNTYFQIGLKHISDLAAYDHILFIVVLCAVYYLQEWKKMLVLVTAFTIGHSITLALSSMNIINIDAALIEFLIPLTIFSTAFYNVTTNKSKSNIGTQNKFSYFYVKYLMAVFFGLIHGLGFSNYFKGLLGRESNIILPLFAFNIGIEVAQLFIVWIILYTSILASHLLKIKHRDWNVFISGGAAGISLILMLETWPY